MHPSSSYSSGVRRVLYLEDNEADVRLMKESLRELDFPVELIPMASGEAALEYLTRTAEQDGRSMPDLILLDLNVPNKSGLEVLTEIKSSPRMRRIPVIVLTSSEAPKELLNVYELGANCVIRKPLGLQDFFTQSSTIANFWFNVASLPPM